MVSFSLSQQQVQKYMLYWYESTNTDASCAVVLAIAAAGAACLLVQMCLFYSYNSTNTCWRLVSKSTRVLLATTSTKVLVLLVQKCKILTRDPRADAGSRHSQRSAGQGTGTHFTCFTSTKNSTEVQMLTPEKLQGR
jgi:hypothetical protein